MSRPAIALLPLILVQCSSAGSEPENLSHGSAAAFHWAQTHISPGTPVSVNSTNGQIELAVDGSEEKQTVSLISPLRTWVSQIESPATIGIHPRMPYFYINDGQGSGQFSIIRVYRIDKERVVDSDISAPIKQRFLVDTGCRIDPDMISVAGQAWAQDSSDMIVTVTSVDRQSYCSNDTAVAMRFDVAQAAVRDVFTKTEFRHQFCKNEIVRDQLGICSNS